jgi:adenylate kinase
MLNGNSISLLFGLPGAGKTTALTKIVPTLPNLVRLSGGSLIATELSTESRDSLRKIATDKILLNQEKLVLNFHQTVMQMTGKHVVFDGHCIIKNGAQIVEIPLSVIERLCPDRLLFFDVSPEVIIEQRRGDSFRPDRETETASELEHIRQRELQLCSQYTGHLDIPFLIITQENELVEALTTNGMGTKYTPRL